MADVRWDHRSASLRDRERDRILREWLAGEVVPFSAFWAERLAGARVRGAEDLGGVPVAERAELAQAGGPGNPALLLLPTEGSFARHASRRELLAAARELNSSGAAGRRLVVFRRYKPVHVHEDGGQDGLVVAYTRTDLDRLHLAGARLSEVLGLHADDTLVNAVPAGPSLLFWGLYHAALATRMTALHPRTAGRDAVASLVAALGVLPPTVLALPVGEAPELLEGLVRAGQRIERLRTVLCVGPPADAATRTAIQHAAGGLGATDVRVQAVWAPGSARALWGECRPPGGDPPEASYGLHTYPDLELLEVRADGGAAGENEPGELVVTTMGWRGTVLVRAATGARTGGLVTRNACPSCRRTVPRLAPQA